MGTNLAGKELGSAGVKLHLGSLPTYTLNLTKWESNLNKKPLISLKMTLSAVYWNKIVCPLFTPFFSPTTKGYKCKVLTCNIETNHVVDSTDTVTYWHSVTTGDMILI